MRFVTNGSNNTNESNKIVIDAKSGALRLSKGVKVVFSNLAKDTYVRMEYKKYHHVDWTGSTNNDILQLDIPSPSVHCYRRMFKVANNGEISITMKSDIDIIRIENTAKSFAQIKFVDQTAPQNVISEVKNPANNNALPRLDLYINAVERLHKEKDKLTKELARSKGMLSNEKFLNNAKPEKVQEEKDKLAKYEQMMAQVEARLAQMK